MERAKKLEKSLTESQKRVAIMKQGKDSVIADHKTVAYCLDSVLYAYPSETAYIVLYNLRYERRLFDSKEPHIIKTRDEN